jgi:long-chain-fatty-acid--CoA ligase ACSBG
LLRGIITGIYTTNSVDSTHFVLERSGATIVVVDDAKQMDKVREIKKRMPHLKVVIQTREPFAESAEGFYRWDDLEKMDVSDVEEEYQRRLADIHANDCCSLIFTSGTTGRPKVRILFVPQATHNTQKSSFFVGRDAESRQSHFRREDWDGV